MGDENLDGEEGLVEQDVMVQVQPDEGLVNIPTGDQIGGISTPDHPNVVRDTVPKDPAVAALELAQGMKQG